MFNTEASFVMMTSLNGNIFRVTGPLPVRGIHRWPLNSPRKGQWRGALIFSLINALKSGWVNNRDAGDLRRHRAHYDVIAMNKDLTLSPACVSLIWYFYTTTGNVWIIPSFWGYVLHVEHVSYVTKNYANPVYSVATIGHQVRWLRWGHPSLFHTATSLLIWYKMFCVRDISYSLIWMEFINMFSVYAQSGTHSRFNW